MIWVCEKCGQRLLGPNSLCNSGLHVGPGDGEEAKGEAVLLEDSAYYAPACECELGLRTPFNCWSCTSNF